MPTLFGTGTDSPISPAFGGISHEWKLFTENFNIEGFGNPEEDNIFVNVTITWINDLSNGD